MKLGFGQIRAGGRGFTLIELLVVIAIIAILVAILFPVFAIVRAKAREGRCMTQLAEIVKAMKMYKEDHGQFPEALYGVAFNAGGPLEPRLVFTDGAKSYIKDREYFTCPSAPNVTRNNNTLVQPLNRMTGAGAMDRYGRPMFIPLRDSYTMQYLSIQPAGTPELHYSLAWQGTGGAADDPRQLRNRNPPSNTVVTWCLYHAERNAAGVPKPGHKALVAFLDGRVAPLPAERLASWPYTDGRYPWQVLP